LLKCTFIIVKQRLESSVYFKVWCSTSRRLEPNRKVRRAKKVLPPLFSRGASEISVDGDMPPQEKFTASGGGVSGDISSKDTSPDGLSASSDGLSVTGKKSAKNHKDGEQDDQPKDMDFDDLLPHVGEFGTYQRILFVLMIPFAFFVAWVYFSQIFITLVPEQHWCRVPELENLTTEKR